MPSWRASINWRRQRASAGPRWFAEPWRCWPSRGRKNRRARDHLHKLTTRLVKENQLIAVEDLCVKGMLRSKRYSRSIADASWGELVRQLEYKASWYGRTFVKVDRFFPSSKTCSACGHVVEAMPEHIRDWDCPSCGVHHDRDINAAKNVLAAGLAVAACGAPVRPNSQKRGRHGQ